MKRTFLLFAIMVVLVASTPSYGFLDYLFSGSANRGAIGNSAVGELRSWWSGNPVYNNNPYHTGPVRAMPGGQSAGGNPYAGSQGAYGPAGAYQQQPMVQNYPPQAPGTYGQGYPQQMQQSYPQQTQQQGYYPQQMQQQGYYGAPQPGAYQPQQQPQAYQGGYPGAYQGQPQPYQPPPQGYYQGGPAAYQGGQQGYPGYPPQ